ncbi:15536_t:CDS:2, partial [Cetraspora pellucida]
MSKSIVISHKNVNRATKELKVAGYKSTKKLSNSSKQVSYNKHNSLKHHNLRNVDVKNVITFYGLVRMPNDKVCLVMEYAENRNLHNHLSGNRLNLKLKTKWAIDIQRGLLACHEHSIMNLDLKTRNIFIDYNLILKIADFGLSYMRPESDIRYEARGLLQWASPEYVSKKLKMQEYYKDQPDLSAKLSRRIADLIAVLTKKDVKGELKDVVKKCCNYNPPEHIALKE